MVILLWVLLGIICVLLVIIAKQKEKMKIQKESNKKVLDEWKWRYGICHNMRRLLFFLQICIKLKSIW